MNDSVWYLRAENNLVRNEWIEDMVAHKKEINDADGSLRRHGSVLSLTSGTSMSNASTSSFKVCIFTLYEIDAGKNLDCQKKKFQRKTITKNNLSFLVG